MKVVLVIGVATLIVFLGAMTIRIAPGIGKLIGFLGTISTIYIASSEVSKINNKKQPESPAEEEQTPQKD